MLETIITAPYTIECHETAIPEITDDEVLIKIKCAGICASDVQVYHGLHKYMTYPLIQGHEAVGYVEAVGKSVTHVKIGDKVVIQPQIACGKCFACRQERPNVCETLKHFGISKPGLFVEYATVPAWNAVKIPFDMSFDQGVFIEPFAIACNAIEKGNVQAGDRIVVIGAGLIGNFIAQASKIKGAEVLVSDILQSKLDLIQKHGIKNVVNTSKEKLSDAIKRVFGEKGVHTIFECAAVNSSFKDAIFCASKASSIVIVGNFKEPFLLEIPLLQRKEIALLSVMGTSRKNFIESCQIMSRGLVNLNGMISNRFPLRELKKAYQYIDQQGDTTKVLLDA
jgi:L-iditol 2-dehydrogenase